MLLRLSRIAEEITKLSSSPITNPEPVIDPTPHGLEGRLRRVPSPGKVKIRKTEGPRAYAPRL